MPLNTDAIIRVSEYYQQCIGEINESTAMRLKDICENYSEKNIMEVFRLAISKNIKNWRYIEKVLEDKKKGLEVDPSKYFRGAYSGCALSSAADIRAALERRRMKQNG